VTCSVRLGALHGSRIGRSELVALSAPPPRQAASVMFECPFGHTLEIVMYIGIGTILVVLLIIYFVRRT
jgi:hypothetical protein